MTKAFGVDLDNENGERIVGLCAEREMCITYTFLPRGIRKFTWNVIDFIPVRGNQRYVYDGKFFGDVGLIIY